MTTVLLIGEIEHAEFRSAVESMRAVCRVAIARDLPEALRRMETGEAPELIVLAQAWPGQFDAASIDGLRRLAPLSRVVGLLGAWCEGETRSGHPWPGVVRVYWHQWLARFHQEVAMLAAGLCPSWGLPATATDDERLLWSAVQPAAMRQGLVRLYTGHAELADWLAGALRAHGLATVWAPPAWPVQTCGASAAIWDSDGINDEAVAELEAIARTLDGAPLLALLSFPRIDDLERVRAAGAAGAISKPCHLGDLIWQLEQFISQQAD